MEKVQSPLRGHRTFSCLSERALRSNPFHYIPGRRVALRATRQPSIPLHSFTLHAHSGISRKKAVGQADSTLSAKSGMAEAMDKKVVRLLCRARPTGGLPFYPSPLPHYRPMGRAAPLGQYVGRCLVSASRKSPYQAETPRFFFGVRSLQP